MPPRPIVRTARTNINVAGPASPVSAPRGMSESNPTQTRTEKQQLQDRINELAGRIVAATEVHEHACRLLNELRILQSGPARTEKINQLMTMLQAPI